MKSVNWKTLKAGQKFSVEGRVFEVVSALQACGRGYFRADIRNVKTGEVTWTSVHGSTPRTLAQ